MAKRSTSKGGPGPKRAVREIEALTGRLEKAEAKAARWKAEAKRAQAEARDSAKQLRKLRKRLDATAAPAASSAPVVAVGELAGAAGLVVAPAAELGTVESAVESAGESAGGPAAEAAAGSPLGSGPGPAWTVTALRVAARERGIAGYSRRSKAELVRLLTE